MNDPTIILLGHLQTLRTDLAVQTGRVSQLRKQVAYFADIGKNTNATRARLRDAEETLACYAAELVRLERELGAMDLPRAATAAVSASTSLE